MGAIAQQEWVELAERTSATLYYRDRSDGGLYPIGGHGDSTGVEHSVAVEIPMTHNGAGGTDAVNDANRRYMEKYYIYDVHDVRGSLVYVFGAGGTINDDELAAEIFGIVERLGEYPIIDDELHGVVEDDE